MKKILCDRCGKEIDEYSMTTVDFDYAKRFYSMDDYDLFHWELCYDCKNDLKKFLNERRYQNVSS